MTKQVIFFHGGDSENDFEADAKLVASLKQKLGTPYSVHYTMLPNDGSPDLGRREQINQAIAASKDNVILVGHSFGASMLLVCLSEMKISRKIAGIFLVAPPFWSGKEDWMKPFMLRPNFEKQLNKDTPMHFYHCHDDEVVPFSDMIIYREHLPWASFHEMPTGGHQFDNDLTIVANDIRSLH